MAEFLLLKRGRFLNFTLTLIASFFLVTTGWGQTEPDGTQLVSDPGITIITDKEDYAPLSNAVFSGSGFEPFEVVILRVKNLSKPCNTTHADQSYAPWSVTTDANGSFVTNWTVCDCPGDSLRLKVVGQTTGKVGYAYFTDANTRILVEDASGDSGGTINLTATLRQAGAGQPGSNNSPVPGRTLNFYLNEEFVGAAVTNSSGVATLTTTVPSSIEPGVYNGGADASFAGDPNNTPYSGTSSNPGGTLTVTKLACTAPSITVSNINSVNNTTGACSASVTIGSNVSVNAGSPAPTVAYSLTSGGAAISNPYTFPVGTTTVYAKANNSCGSDTESFTVTVIDAQDPTIETLSAISVNADVDSCTYASSQLTAPDAADNCSVSTVVASPASLELGENTVTWTVTDGAGRTAISTQTVTVIDAQDPTIETLSAISVNVDVDSCTYASSQLTAPDAADNCSVSTVVASPASLELGENTVTWTVTDGAGLTATSTQTVTVVDEIRPTVVTQNITVQLDENGSATITAAHINYGSTDNCEIASYTLDITSFDCSNVGANTVELTVTDVNGNSSSGTAIVTVQDNVAPTVVTQNITVQLDENGSATIIADQINNGSTDNCEIASYALDITSFDCSNVGANTVELTVTDVNDNSSSGTATVTVEDNVAPEALTQNITVQLDANGNATITAAHINNGSTDNCEIASYTLDITSFDCSNVGANTVELTVTDVNGNSSSGTATVTVQDNVAPTVVTQNITVQLDENGSATIIADQINNGSTDNCEIASYALDITSFDCSNVGANTVELTVTDVNDNSSSGTATVTVEDNVAPEALTQNITVQLDANGNATITAADIDNGSNDACGIASMSVSPNSFTCANVGPNTVTLTVTDNNGNISTATATVTVEDNVAPEALTQNITVQLDANGNATITAEDIDNGSNDACGIASLAVSQTEFTCANVGPNTVTLTVTDNNGNISTADATVTVEDNVAPEALTQNITVQLDANGNATITAEDIDNGSNDACGIASLAVSQTDFTCANVGPNTVTLTVTDNNGNISTADATVTVEDNVAPEALTQNITVQLDATGSASITAADVNDGSSDSCGIASLAVSQTDFTCANVGPNTVTLTVTDNNGNISTADATVTVEDNVAPEALTQNITVQLDANGNATITAEDIDNGSNDACGIASLAVSQTDFTCANVGPNTVTLTVTDNNGNISTADATVTVEDNVAPEALTQNITVQLDANGNATITAEDIDNGSNDACGIASLAVSQTDFTCANVGPNTVTLTVTDNNGNISTADATVTVEDNVAPEALTQNITVQLDANGNATITAEDIDNGSNDACGIASLAVSQTDFTCANVGPNTVTLTVTDNNGNISTADATVTVEDNVAPEALTQNITVQLDANGNATITAEDIDNGSNDACGIASMSVSPNSFTCANVGPNTVTLTVTDNNGNISTADATVTVEDNVAPEALTQNITVQLDANGNATITAEDIDNGSNDACGIASLAVSQTEFTCANVGPNTVTLTVTDNNGNISTADATVTVEDNVAPEALTQNITVQLDANGNATITAEDIDNGSNDACGIASLAVSQTDFTCANVGPNTVTLTVTDNNGNISTADATVTVEDNVAPTVVTQDIIVELDANGSATITAAQINNGSTDNCTIDTYELDNYSFDCNNVGSDNTVTLTVTDVNGNSASETATVTVEDNIAPTVLTQNITVELGADGTATITADQINNGSTDNCTIDTYELDNYSFNCANVGSDNTVTLIVTDVNGNSSSETATVTVEDNIAPIVLTQNITVELGADGTATITAAQINNASTDNCTIDTYELDNYSFNCANVGSDNTVTLTVTDVNGNSASETATVTVEDNIAPIITTEAVNYTVESDGIGNVAAFQTWLENNGGAEATDNCNTITWTNNFIALSDGCGETGVAVVTFTAKDASGNVDTTTATFTIEDTSAPNLGSIVAIHPVAVNTTFTLTAPSSDLNGISNATWYFNSNGDATATASQQVTPNSQSISGSSVSATFNFGTTKTGVYSVLLVVEDACGNRSEVVYEYVVVYDPSGGFVTGGGWITSPIINGVEYMGVEGRANFGFNAKYKTGRNNLTEVDGNTNFQFKEGDFHFKSIAHQNMSLVISGEHKATYRGIGTVNGSGSHYFIVTVIDGDAPAGGGADKFRITVFPNGSTSPSGQPVYDNEFGAAANADASTTLGGGSIVIHKPKSSGKTAEVVEKVSVTASEEAIVEILESMAVAPNPVREEARVRFSLIEDASVVLRVFDFNGREVEKLFSGNVRAHEVKEVSFQRRNLMSGVYILKLTTDRGNSYDKQIIVE